MKYYGNRAMLKLKKKNVPVLRDLGKFQSHVSVYCSFYVIRLSKGYGEQVWLFVQVVASPILLEKDTDRFPQYCLTTVGGSNDHFHVFEIWHKNQILSNLSSI